jgi:hypothetical protein
VHTTSNFAAETEPVKNYVANYEVKFPYETESFENGTKNDKSQ